jgi:PAS domain-containing protein
MDWVDGLMLKPLSEEQRLRAELERARGALAHMQEVARLGTWERDETTGIVEWSQGLETLLGFGPQTQRALETWLDLVHPRRSRPGGRDDSRRGGTWAGLPVRVPDPRGRRRPAHARGRTDRTRCRRPTHPRERHRPGHHGLAALGGRPRSERGGTDRGGGRRAGLSGRDQRPRAHRRVEQRRRDHVRMVARRGGRSGARSAHHPAGAPLGSPAGPGRPRRRRVAHPGPAPGGDRPAPRRQRVPGRGRGQPGTGGAPALRGISARHNGAQASRGGSACGRAPLARTGRADSRGYVPGALRRGRIDDLHQPPGRATHRL